MKPRSTSFADDLKLWRPTAKKTRRLLQHSRRHSTERDWLVQSHHFLSLAFLRVSDVDLYHLPSILTIETLQKQFNRRDNAVIYVHRPLHCESQIVTVTPAFIIIRISYVGLYHYLIYIYICIYIYTYAYVYIIIIGLY